MTDPTPTDIPRHHDAEDARRERDAAESKRLKTALLVIGVLVLVVFPLAYLFLELALGVVMIR
jgi:hypothetical protein